MRLGISSYTFVWAVGVPGYPAPARPLTPLGLLDKAVALGVRVVWIVDEVASARIGVCLDTANSLGCSEGPDVVLDALGPRTCCLHVKDYTIRRLPHRFGFLVEGGATGRGDLDLPRWLGRRRELGRDVNVILELWPGPESSLEAAIAKEQSWAEQSIA